MIAVDYTSPGQSYAFDDIVTCVEGEGSIRIVSVELLETTGVINVVKFSTLPANSGDTMGYLDNQSEGLAEAGFPDSGPLIIDARCPDSKESAIKGRGYAVIGVEVQRGEAPATARGMRVTYTSAGKTQSIDVPLGIVLCDDVSLDELNGEVNPACDTAQLDIR